MWPVKPATSAGSKRVIDVSGADEARLSYSDVSFNARNLAVPMQTTLDEVNLVVATYQQPFTAIIRIER